MRKKEQLLWDALKRNAPESLWLQRVENVVSEGMPDVYIGATGAWLELKAPSRIPARDDTPLLGAQNGLRISQINWHLKNASMLTAPQSYILIRTTQKELLLLPGRLAGIVNACSLSALRAAKLNQATTTEWDEIVRILQ